MTDRTVVRLLAGFCVGLALMCLGLGVAYAYKAAEARCFAEAAELGLTPWDDCRQWK
jgi:hypothetical protein